MKKLLSFLLVLTLMMGVCSLTACDLFNQLVGNQSTEAITTTTTTTTTTAPNKPVPPTNECVHSFGEWITVSAATFESTGLKKQVCSKCTHIHWEEIPVLKIDITLWVSPTAGMREFTAAKIEEFIEVGNPDFSGNVFIQILLWYFRFLNGLCRINIQQFDGFLFLNRKCFVKLPSGMGTAAQ